MEFFSLISPSILLAPYIKHYWILKNNDISGDHQRVFSSGSIHLIFHRGERLYSSKEKCLQPASFIYGHYVGFNDLIPTSEVDMIVVVFQPFGIKPFFSVPANEFENRSIAADETGDIALKELSSNIRCEQNDNTAIGLIEEYLVNKLYSFDYHNFKRMKYAINSISEDPGINIKLLADKTCLSYKQFNRVFSNYIGTNPKDFSRTVRFHKSLHTLQLNSKMSLTDLAFHCGYYDQPHMNKEFKLFSGFSPKEYLAVCTPHSDYFSD